MQKGSQIQQASASTISDRPANSGLQMLYRGEAQDSPVSADPDIIAGRSERIRDVAGHNRLLLTELWILLKMCTAAQFRPDCG
jgi:hypothetical protein